MLHVFTCDIMLRCSLVLLCVNILQLEGLMVPAPGSEPLAFKSVYAASGGLQGKACIERALKQVREGNRTEPVVQSSWTVLSPNSRVTVPFGACGCRCCGYSLEAKKENKHGRSEENCCMYVRTSTDPSTP